MKFSWELSKCLSLYKHLTGDSWKRLHVSEDANLYENEISQNKREFQYHVKTVLIRYILNAHVGFNLIHVTYMEIKCDSDCDKQFWDNIIKVR